MSGLLFSIRTSDILRSELLIARDLFSTSFDWNVKWPETISQIISIEEIYATIKIMTAITPLTPLFFIVLRNIKNINSYLFHYVFKSALSCVSMILGIESTAHTFGIGIVKDGKIIANVKDAYTTEKGGIIPIEAAKHHERVSGEVYKKAIAISGISENDISAIAFSQGPGLSPCLLQGIKFAKELASRLKVPIIPVNHCIAHLEIGRLTGAKNPVLLYASGANTQIISYASGKYRVFGETLDIGIGNFIDKVARHFGIKASDLILIGEPKGRKLNLKQRELLYVINEATQEEIKRIHKIAKIVIGKSRSSKK